MTEPSLDPYIEARISRTDECWTWTGPLAHRNGPGVCRDTYGARWRVACYLFAFYGGELPRGVHTVPCCETRNCIRPRHQAVPPPKAAIVPKARPEDTKLATRQRAFIVSLGTDSHTALRAAKGELLPEEIHSLLVADALLKDH